MTTPPIILKINGVPHEGFTSVEVTRSVSDMAGVCTATLSDKWSSGYPNWGNWDVLPGMPVQVFYGPLLVLTGLIDNVNPSYDAENHGIQITSRSKTKDPVDSSAEMPNGEMENVTLDQIAGELLRPYGMTPRIEAEMGEPFSRAAVIDGETVQETLERYARQRGVLVTDDAEGNPRLVQVKNQAPTFALTEGINILAGSSTLTEDKRHSEYKTTGQDAGTDQKHGRDVSEVEAKTTDPAIGRHRPLQLLPETAANDITAQQRTDWEAAYRGGESVQASITAPAWGPTAARLYTPGEICMLTAPLLKVNRPLALQSVRHSETNEGGTVTECTLVPVEALNPKAGEKPAAGQSAPAWTETRPTTPAR